jgi:hypothetical protein
VSGGDFVLTSLVPNGFVQNPSNEDITTNSTATIDLTSLSHVPLGTVTLIGTVTQEVEGRQNPTNYGSQSGSLWTAYITSMSMSGTVDGYPLTLALNPADLALDVGQTSLVQEGANYGATSFFDVFVEVSYDGPNGLLTTTMSGTASATNAPEPATLALLAVPLLVVPAIRRRPG